MTKVTVIVGVLLAAIGVVGAHMYGAALHPLWTGLLLILCGLLANSESPKQRMLWMHIAVTVGLLGFLVPGIMSMVGLSHLHAGVATISADRIHEQMLVALICLIYVVLCVRSFITARRSRTV